MAITSTDNQTAAAHTDEVDLVASKDASTDETTEPAPDETSKLETAASPEEQVDTDPKVTSATEVDPAQKDEASTDAVVEGAKEEGTTLEGTATKGAKESTEGATESGDATEGAKEEATKESATKESDAAVEGEPVETIEAGASPPADEKKAVAKRGLVDGAEEQTPNKVKEQKVAVEPRTTRHTKEQVC